MSQSQPYVFVWTHGGKRVSLAGTFNGWNPEPVPRQGNYFVTVKNIPEGHHQYKFVVDNVWLYDVDQISADDGSGNWNNVAVIGDEEHCPYLHSHDNKQGHHQQQQHHHREAALTSPTPAKQAKKDVQQTEASSDKPALSKKEQRKQEFEQKQQQKQQEGGAGGKKGGKGGQGGQGGQQQQKQQQKTPQKAPEPEEEEEAAPAAQEEDEAPAPAKEAKKEKSSESMVVVDVATADIDTDIAALEAFVRSVNPAGLKWEGSSVSDYVFGLKKLTIICRCQDDVSVEDVCSQLEQNNELVGSAQIQSFAC